jgi:hypothetical protein
MPFSPQVKTAMFVRCARLCCICLKQCGTKIEAAHIVAEAKGGTCDEDNGIPLCFDCHTEVGSYNDEHPKGNKFRPPELRAHRDRVYQWVESGVLHAQMVARQIRRQPQVSPEEIEELGAPPRPSGEAKKLLSVLTSDSSQDAPDRKVRLLSPSGRAFVIDSLLEDSPTRPSAVAVLCRAATPNLLSAEEQRITIERLVRAVTLFGSPWTKAALFSNLSTEVFGATDEGLRLTLFQEVIAIIGRDQFREVNDLVPALENHVVSVPAELHGEFVLALLKHSWSEAHQGAPSARRMLLSLSNEMAEAALPRIDKKFLYRYSRQDVLHTFVRHYGKLADLQQRPMLEELLKLSDRDFRDKYLPDD